MGGNRRLLAVLLIASVALAACAPAATPLPTPPPTERPTPTPVPGPTFGVALEATLLAINIDFDRVTLDVPANAPFVIHFRNADSQDIPHDVDIRRPNGVVVEEQDPIDGGTQADYTYLPLPAGDYLFICSVHPIPAMTGTLRVR